MEQVLCKECKHAFRDLSDVLVFNFSRYAYKCRKNFTPDNVEADPVLGPVSRKGKFETCSYTRLNSQPCGEDGTLWEPKNTRKHLFTIIKHEEQLNDR